MGQHSLDGDARTQAGNLCAVEGFCSSYAIVYPALHPTEHPGFKPLRKGAAHGFRGNALRQSAQSGLNGGLYDRHFRR